MGSDPVAALHPMTLIRTANSEESDAPQRLTRQMKTLAVAALVSLTLAWIVASWSETVTVRIAHWALLGLGTYVAVLLILGFVVLNIRCAKGRWL